MSKVNEMKNIGKYLYYTFRHKTQTLYILPVFLFAENE